MATTSKSKGDANKGRNLAAEWDALWGAYAAAFKAGEDLTAKRAEIKRWHEDLGWPVPPQFT